MKKASTITEEFYQATRSAGSQSARLYGLAKVHKTGTPFRIILSIRGSCYDNLNRERALIVKKLSESHINCSRKTAAKTLRELKMKRGEDVASPNVKSLTMVPRNEVVESTAELLSERDALGDLSKDTFHELIMLAVSNVVFLLIGKYKKKTSGWRCHGSSSWTVSCQYIHVKI